MRIYIKCVSRDKEERILIECYEVREEISNIIDFVKLKDTTLTAYMDQEEFYISLHDIFYIDSVDNKVFVYLKDKVYELRNKLYELESLYGGRSFFRCSKSVIVNLMKIECIKPALNSRFVAKMKNGEEVIISRKYVPELKKKLQ
ncbi:MAG: LytTR family DNA-binding domain-containing protein [Herbinix sp.]|nr:LytTR family DNA-binding domain-containing protein [Herbinix sp.]